MTEEIKETEKKEMTDEEKLKLLFQKKVKQSFETGELVFLKMVGFLINGYLSDVISAASFMGKCPVELFKATKEKIMNNIANFEKQFAKKETKEEKPEGK